MAKTARKPVAPRKRPALEGSARTRPTLAAAAGLASTVKAAQGGDPQCYLAPGSGWAHQDPGTPIASVVPINAWLSHVSLRLKVTNAATATWEVATIPDWHFRPESVRANLPCAVRDASAKRWYVGLCQVTGGGVISVTAGGPSTHGSIGPPFPLQVNDEVHVNVTYFNP